MNKLDKIDNIFVVVASYTMIASFFITPAFIYSLFQKWYIVKGFKVIEGATSITTSFHSVWGFNTSKLIITILFGIVALILGSFALWRIYYVRRIKK